MRKYKYITRRSSLGMPSQMEGLIHFSITSHPPRFTAANLSPSPPPPPTNTHTESFHSHTYYSLYGRSLSFCTNLSQTLNRQRGLPKLPTEDGMSLDIFKCFSRYIAEEKRERHTSFSFRNSQSKNLD